MHASKKAGGVAGFDMRDRCVGPHITTIYEYLTLLYLTLASFSMKGR